MATLFPASTDNGTTLPDPSAGNFLNSPDHASLHSNANGAIKALEAKLGTGASTPVTNTFLIGNGTGTTTYSSLTSAQLAARITDETGTGLAVFATTPTLITPRVDTINEATATNGVTIDGLNIKDGALNTNNSVITASVADAAITPAKLVAGTGITWVYNSWIPAWTNLTTGNGTLNYARYIQIGKTVEFRLKFTLGGSSAVSGVIGFTLPVNLNPTYSTPQDIVTANGQLKDATGDGFLPWVSYGTSSRADIRFANGAANYQDTSSTAPFTWAVSDVIMIAGSYEAA